MDGVTGKILGATNKAGYFLDGLKFSSWPFSALDIIIVSFLLYSAYLLIRETRAIRILYGLFFLIALMGLGYLLNLVLLNWILKYVMAMLVVAIPIVFQPELRNALEKIGRSGLIKDFSHRGGSNYIEQLVLALEYFSDKKIGVLIVIQRQTGLRDYVEKGIIIDSEITKELLSTIFYPKTPLHDGAVIIANERIEAAAVMLPTTEADLSTQLGSRHRAAIGIAENSDAVAIVVSEETGIISMAVSGKMERRLSSEKLKLKLNRLL